MLWEMSPQEREKINKEQIEAIIKGRSGTERRK